MKRRVFPLVTITCILLAALIAAPATASAKDSWTSVRSKNFFLMGNGSEKEIRQVANKLEQFRDVFTRLFSQAQFNSPVPTTVLVFKSDSSYKPFKVGSAIGYFQPGQDVNYITLTTELHNEENPYRTIFHEYVHLLVKNTMGSDVPVWFNEGLAEYYSTFDIDDQRKVYLGKVISNHVLYLRDQKMLPLKALLTVDHRSPYYNESNKVGVFYAESWAFVHYLLQNNNGQRVSQMGTFLKLQASGMPLEDAFKQAFQADFAAVEKELKEYVQRSTYRMTTATFEKKLEYDAEMQSAPVTEAEAQGYLGDLLLHLGDLNGAEGRLQQALQLDPNLAMANSSLGMVRVRQGKFTEARPLLQKAVTENTQNYLAHFNYALALNQEAMGAGNVVSGFTDEQAGTMRAELKKAIQLAPWFAESYELLAFVNLVRNEQIDESIALLKRAIALSPGSENYPFMLAQLYMRKEDFKGARQILEPLAHSSGADPQLRANAQSLLDSIARMEEQMARYKERQREMSDGESSNDATGNVSSSSGNVSGNGNSGAQPPRLKHRGDPAQPAPQNDETQQGPSFTETGREIPIRKPEAGEEQVRGLLMRIECDAKGATFIVKVGDQLFKLRTTDFNGIQFTTYTPDIAGSITCGARNPANDVVVTFRTMKDARAKFNGDVVAIDFVPKDFELKK